MKLTSCPTCGQVVSKTARSCPHCGEMFLSGLPVVNKKLGCGGILGIGFLALIVFGAIRSMSDPSSSELRTKAIVKCHLYVQDRLKAPATAEFPWGDQASDNTDGTYTVGSYVDAQNSFGALIRTHYTCKVRHIGRDRWELIGLNL